MNSTTSTMISYLSLALAVSILCPTLTMGARCSKSGDCMYGGVCTPDGYCSCIFSCKTELWGKELYCGLPGRGRKIFMNLCQLRSHACSLQKDIPIIRLDSRKNFKKTCRQAPPTPLNRLCSQTTEACGTSRNMINKNPGVCLESTSTSEKFCKCPNDMKGANCERKWMLPNIAGNQANKRSSAVVAVSVTFFLAFALALSCILNKKCKKAAGPKSCAYLLEMMRIRRKGDDQCRTLTDLESNQFSNHEKDESSPVKEDESSPIEVLSVPQPTVNERTRLNSNTSNN